VSKRARSRRPAVSTDKKTSVRCAIYTRVSTDDGLDQDFNSLDAQREAAEAYVASQKSEGWTCLPDHFDDGGFSGGSMDRPALRRLLIDVEAHRVDCIVVYKLDRLSRSLLDFAQIIGALERNGVSFVSITQQFNTTASTGRLLLNVLLSFAQFERELISERTRDKVCAARRKGKWTGGSPILGYDIVAEGGRLIVNKTEAARVRAIFDLYAEKESLLDTVQELDRRGWTTKRWTTKDGQERGGKPFGKNALHQLLLNPTYIGRVKHNGSTYAGEHEAIVEQEVWERVQKLLRRNGRSGGRATRNKHGALLGGLLWCASCGVKMTHTYAQKGEKRYRYYVCSEAQRRGWDACPTKSLPAGEIERFVVAQIKRIGQDPKLLSEVLKAATTEAAQRRNKLAREEAAIKRDLRSRAAEVKRLVGATAKGRGKKADAAARLADLQDQVDQGEQRLGEIRAEKAGLEREQIGEGELATALRDFTPVWESLSPREQAWVVHLVVERVAYDREKESVAITFRPSGLKTLSGEGVA
jgi:site-specific DNA recombinase